MDELYLDTDRNLRVMSPFRRCSHISVSGTEALHSNGSDFSSSRAALPCFSLSRGPDEDRHGRQLMDEIMECRLHIPTDDYAILRPNTLECLPSEGPS
jgi:hypothetical protein